MTTASCRLSVCWTIQKKYTSKKNWHKPNPSLQYLPNLLEETRKEYKEWLENRSSSSDFMTKRMNWRQGNGEVELTSWDNIMATKQEVEPPKAREIAVAGIDYTKINDFASAGVLTKRGEKGSLEAKTWVCLKSADLPRIKYPLHGSRRSRGTGIRRRPGDCAGTDRGVDRRADGLLFNPHACTGRLQIRFDETGACTLRLHLRKQKI